MPATIITTDDLREFKLELLADIKYISIWLKAIKLKSRRVLGYAVLS
ncbi:hypothetical protein [Winogradskyella sp. PC D3.3]